MAGHGHDTAERLARDHDGTGRCALAVLVTAGALWAIKWCIDRYDVRWAVWAVWGVLVVKVAIVLLHAQWLVLI